MYDVKLCTCIVGGCVKIVPRLELPGNEGFSVLCNTKFSRRLISHASSSKLTVSLPLDSWYCSRNVVSVRFTSLAVFFTFQPVYYSTDPYPHNGGTFGIARWQARVRCSQAGVFIRIKTLGALFSNDHASLISK